MTMVKAWLTHTTTTASAGKTSCGGAVSDDYPHTVESTWLLAFQQMRAEPLYVHALAVSETSI